MKKSTCLRLVCAALILMLLLPALFSCADNGKGDGTTSARAEQTRDPMELQFPDEDYGGEEFVVYARTQNAAHYQGFYIVPFEDSADVIDEEAVRRNIRTEERYHVKIRAMEADSPHSTLERDIASGEVPYHVMLSYRNSMGSLALKGLYYNFNNLNCDLTSAWWDKNAAEQYEVAGKVYLMPNDVSVSNLAGTRFFFFSKGLLEDYHLKSPYDYEAENNWTLDSFLTLVKSIDNPTSGENYGAYGMMDEEDYTVFHMLTGAGVPRVEQDADGRTVCKLGTDYADRAQDFLEKYKAVADKKTNIITIQQAVGLDRRSDVSGDTFLHARQLFVEDHFLFIHTDMEVAAREFKEMTRGFGVIMNPKYDANQKEYYHQMDNNSLIWGIPNDANLDMDMVSNVFDYWAYCSSSTVMEAFFELTIKAKRASDPTACKMLDTIKSSIRYYMTDLYNCDDTYNVLYQSYYNSVSSAWTSYARSIERQLNHIYDVIDALED